VLHSRERDWILSDLNKQRAVQWGISIRRRYLEGSVVVGEGIARVARGTGDETQIAEDELRNEGCGVETRNEIRSDIRITFVASDERPFDAILWVKRQLIRQMDDSLETIFYSRFN